MKKIIFALPFFCMALFSCKKFLDKKPESGLVEEDYFRNTTEVETGVFGIYDGLQAVLQEEYKLTEMRSDMVTPANREGEWGSLEDFNETSTNDFVRLFWQLSYNTIGRSNLVIKYLNNVTDTTKKKYFEGEAKLIRAHMYFNLVRLWGDVPLIKEVVPFDENDKLIRKSKTEVYNLIVSDLQTAINDLPVSWSSSEAGRVTQGAAKTLLAKVYLTLGQYAQAKPLLDAVASSSSYQLLSNYADVFSLTNEMNKEIIYAVRYKAGANGEGQAFTYDFSSRGTVKGIKPNTDFMSLYVTADSVRKKTSVTGSGSNVFVGKFQDPTAADRDAGNDWIVTRLADAILLQGETNANLYTGTWGAVMSDADSALIIGPINRIRARAGAGLTRKKKSDYADLASYMNDLMRERKIELAFENDRWYDLLRWGNAVAIMNAHFPAINRATSTMKPYQVLMPIPQREIDVSHGTITQNPGY
jgi:hypothetical protein